ncbi:adaptin ear-binding coat-associated protein 2 [Beauveria brongniartii RCEF 3172]|uniref:Adaptin ear-binding coat-associated protein 2 n=1 Tax=Beauveria brongniartii RCEF 3172 TaxID=1081107 RepID=A0A166YC49_9HYPO|nr:adaptin ear-binding coat-associated protein 2 [Beauveria brongniartii RCEF 3172]
MELLDPATGRPLPADAIQRVLFIAEKVHVYSIPPMASMRGHVAASWTTDPSRQIFSARIRVIETSYDSSPSPSPSSSSSPQQQQQQQLKVDTVLEDPATGQLFAASPYADPAAVDPAVDSSRFFALTVRDEAGRKAVLGIGFEERPEAFDFAVALQEARKALGWEAAAAVRGDIGQRAGRGGEDKKKTAAEAEDAPKDYSLKEGETITINIGGKFGRRRQPQQVEEEEEEEEEKGDKSGASLQSFALAPPPSSASSSSSLSSSAAVGRPEGSTTSVGGGDGGFALPPPPSAQDLKSKRKSLMQMGFDDGQFGEFA